MTFARVSASETDPFASQNSLNSSMIARSSSRALSGSGISYTPPFVSRRRSNEAF